MSLRWKNQRREPDYANPDLMGGYRPASAGFAQEPTYQQVLSNQAAAQMQGYVPGPTYDGFASSQYASDIMRGYNESNPYNSTAFDPKTASKAEIKAMQSKLGVKADGVWGKRSQAAYDASNAVAPSEEDILRSNMNNLGRGMGGDAGAGAVDLYGRQMQQREQVQDEITKLQTRLNEINTRIAEIDRTLPGGGSNDNAWEIAAQRASIGDMSAYDNMVQRGATGAQSSNNIENALMDAEKLTWGLSADSTEDQKAARNQLEVAMRRAERDAKQSGIDVTKIPSYQRIQAALNGGTSGMNNQAFVNYMRLKMAEGKFYREDQDLLKKLAKDDPNSKDFQMLLDEWEKSKGKTVEDKAEAKREAERIEKLFKDLQSMTPAQQQEYWDKKMSKKDRAKLLKIASWKDGYLVGRK